MKTAADKDLSTNLKSIMLILGFILVKRKKSPGGTIFLKNVEKTFFDILSLRASLKL